MEMLEETGLTMYDIKLGNVHEAAIVELDPSLRLGAQSPEDRQREIDRFQKGKSLYAAFSAKAGGVGLSLHHTDEFTTFKCRRKDSGYAVEEDIVNVPTRPREYYGSLPYSAIDLVQMLGRCPRLTSLSNTNQTILGYRGTIEERILAVVSLKLRCLKKVVSTKESWEDVVLGEKTAESHMKEITNGEEDDGLIESEEE